MSYQNPDKLIIEKDTYEILSCFIPEKHQNIKALPKEEYKSKYSKNREYYRNTACQRRYYATWKIENNKLFLINLIGEFELIDEKELFADWFTGTIIIGFSGLDLTKNDIKMPYGHYYEKTINIVIDRGIVLKKYRK